MNYNEFINRVTALLLYDSIEDDEQHTAFIDQHIRSWMSTMQYLVSNFRTRNENTYYENDMQIKCKGGIITLPSELRSLTSLYLIRPSLDDCDPILYESDGETISVPYSNDYNNGLILSGGGEVASNGIHITAAIVNDAYSWDNTNYTITSDGNGLWSLIRVSDGAIISTYETAEKVPVGTWDGQPDAVVVEDAGLVAYRGLYLRDGSSGTFISKPRYTKLGGTTDEDSIMWIDNFGAQWSMFNSNANRYADGDTGAATPVEAEWIAAFPADEPAPTVRYATWEDIDDAGVDRSTVPLFGTPPTVTAVEFCESDCSDEHQLLPVKWNDRGDVLSGDKCFSYAINQSATTLYVHPFPENKSDRPDAYLRVNWDGVKSDYDGEDVVPFGLDTIDNCAHYLNAQLARKKEDKLDNYKSYYSSYLEGRKEIALAQRDKSKQTS